MIVPHVDEQNYANEMDRCMLYIACTRAMHELHLTHDGPLSHFLEFAKVPRSRLDADDAETAEIRDRVAEARVG
nr:hypothetical protein [Qaidamihabitans albus]